MVLTAAYLSAEACGIKWIFCSCHFLPYLNVHYLDLVHATTGDCSFHFRLKAVKRIRSEALPSQSLHSSSLQPFHHRVPSQDLGMPMRARHQKPQPNRSSYRFRHLPLIHGSQVGLIAMLNPAHLSHILAHDCKVLVVMNRVYSQPINHVVSRFRPPPQFLPLGHFYTCQIVRRVDIARSPATL